MATNNSNANQLGIKPRPGLLTALGVANLILTILGALFLLTTVFWVYISLTSGFSNFGGNEVKATVVVSSNGTSTTSVSVNGTTATATDKSAKGASAAPTPPASTAASNTIVFNPLMGTDDPNFMRFCVADSILQVPMLILMFATGIGLLNHRRWAAKWWTIGSWIRIISACLLGGYFIVVVVPTLSQTTTKSVMEMFRTTQPNRTPPEAVFLRIYSIMYLIMGFAYIFYQIFYPVIALIVLHRPSVRAALDAKQSNAELTEL